MAQFNNLFISLKSVKGKPFLYMDMAWLVQTVAAHAKSNSTWLLGSPNMPIWICNFQICQFEDCYVPLFLSFSVPLSLLPLSPNFHQCHNPACCQIPRVTLCSLSTPTPHKHTSPSTNTHTLLPANPPTTTTLTLEVFLLPPQICWTKYATSIHHKHTAQVCVSVFHYAGPKPQPWNHPTGRKEHPSSWVLLLTFFLPLSLPLSLRSEFSSPFPFPFFQLIQSQK